MGRVSYLRPRLVPASPKGGNGSWAPDSIRGNRHQRGYGKDWEVKRECILKRDDGLCQVCLPKGHWTMATQVDHKIPRAWGGTDDDANLQSICGDCHKEKTAKEGSMGAAP